MTNSSLILFKVQNSSNVLNASIGFNEMMDAPQWAANVVSSFVTTVEEQPARTGLAQNQA